MALSATSLEARIKAKLKAKFGQDVADQYAGIEAIAEAIVEEIKANAVVKPTALVSSFPGSPVTGTGKVE